MSKAAQWMLIVLLTGCARQTPMPTAAYPTTNPTSATETYMQIDTTTRDKLESILTTRQTQPPLDAGSAIAHISQQFLGTPYVADRLVGSATLPEKLVVDFRGLDCFTYLDYVEALRHANTQQQFVQRLIATRYINGEVRFLKRKHFFSDWAHQPEIIAKDITTQLSPHAITLEKHLNQKADGSQYLAGLPNVTRSVSYIPGGYVDQQLLNQLRTGDYIGIYSHLNGLDVTHVGIYVMTPEGPMLRNASSREHNHRVVDSPFIDYVLATPGIIVLRPL
ncbi:DUF1460 domain-containing protein [Serratia sp. NPDC078593]|uniref:DUF1460 domain-containing protein n=1 Tax=unclassified Serratia (in: enterobacteria) TaxID=2647522 RepID=UPI0037CD8088